MSTKPPDLSNALFTKVQQRVLGIIFGNPDRTFYANEIIRLAGSGTGAVQRELAKLQLAELVVVEHVGNQKHFRANKSAPVFEELRSLVVKTSGLADVVRAVLAPVAAQIRVAFIFGSFAKRVKRGNAFVTKVLAQPKIWLIGSDDALAA